MLDFLASISDAIVTLFSFLISQVQNMWHLLTMLVHGSTFLTACIAYMPPAISYFAAAAIVISVIFLIIGR